MSSIENNNQMNCETCHLEINDNKYVTCNKCLNTYHPTCQNLMQSELKVLQRKNCNIRWYCDTCSQETPSSSSDDVTTKLDIVVNSLVKITTRLDAYDNKLSQIEILSQNIKEINKNLSKLESIKTMVEKTLISLAT